MKKTLFMTMATIAATAAMAQQIQYPKAAKDGTVEEYFGTKVADPYRWLENDTSAQTAAWVEAENKVTNAYLKKIPFRGKLLKRLTELANYEKIGAPRKRHGKWYFYKNNGLQNQYVMYQMDELGAEPRVFLDPNTLSTDGTVALKGVYFSHNGRWAAYSISRSGSDWQEFFVIDLATGKTTADHIEWAKFSGAAWQGDGFYYSAYDAPVKGKEFSNVNETHKIYYHKVGTPQTEDVLFYQNPAQPKRFYDVSINDEETVMYLYEGGAGAGNNLYVRDLRQKDSQFIQMTSDMDYQYRPVLTDGNKLFIYTNYGAPKGRIMTTDISRPGVNDWQELIAEQPSTLSDIDVINRQLILTYQQDASDHAYVYTTDGKLRHEVKLPGVGSVGFTGDKKEADCFLTFTSFTQPGTIYRYDMEHNESTLYAAPNVKFRQDEYTTEQVFFQSKDGTRIPMFLTYKKDKGNHKPQISNLKPQTSNLKSQTPNLKPQTPNLKPQTSNLKPQTSNLKPQTSNLKPQTPRPVYLYGYGGFNISLGPSFSSTLIPFLENGGIYAQVNLRGGGEYGEEWHLAGTKMQKQNVFDDFIGAAEWLIREGYTTKEKLAIAGGSNGGLLVGACMTQRPDLFRVAIPEVGVMDMLRYHKFTIGWNWASDYGTSEDSPEMFKYLYGYSPLHNLKPGTAYPATLVTTADHDDRVVPAHSFKFAATLQECQSATQQSAKQPLPPVLIRIDTKAGHGGGKPLAKVLEEQADIFGFIMQNIGMKMK